ncbi:MAG: PfaD family polyunsaturated fatty acid/polyketide biosynthesis protein [Deltaproteobacteria bacterium]|nr:PfaD family polyunsaturated fatty acid/polyketide biosynthesis protein [Deltaproteobacteria bacterium]
MATSAVGANESEVGGAASGEITAESLGSRGFKGDYRLRYAYLAGGMAKGIASEELVIRIGRAGMMGFFGTGGLEPDRIEAAIRTIQEGLPDGKPYGMNLLFQLGNPTLEEQTVDLFLRYGVRVVEAAAYLQISPALVRYRLTGLERGAGGEIRIKNRIIAKLSRPEIAKLFLSPAPERLVADLLRDDRITREQAELAGRVPMADDLCVEADSGGHTDQGVLTILVPAIIRLRDEMARTHGYAKTVRVGAAGGIGTPAAAAAAFMLGADFIVTGSINQCTAEARISDAVKEILQGLDVQDTAYAPAGDLFTLGAKVQVVRKGIMFPLRANKLYDLYRRHDSLDGIDAKTRQDLEQRYFKRTLDEVYEETRAYWLKHNPEEIRRAEQDPKQRMALVFRWYFGRALALALEGDVANKADYQIYCGPAMGAFNQWVKGTGIEDWRNRHVDQIAEQLMRETAGLMNARLKGPAVS